MTTSSETLLRRHLHPAASEQIESKLVARQIDHVFEPNLPLDAIQNAEGQQVRLDRNRAPKQMVEQYAEQMKRGAIFPAIVVNEHRQLLDGNARCTAALKRGQTVIPAYVCSGVTELEARSLSIELNQSHGLRMTDQEVRAFVAGCIRDGKDLDTKSYARMTGAKPSTIGRWVAVEKFRMRAAGAGLDPSDVAALSEAAQAALSGARLDSVYRAATALALAADLSATSIKAIVARANAAASEHDALAIVDGERLARNDEVRARNASIKARRSNRSTLHIAGLLHFAVDDFLDVAPENQPGAFRRLRMVRDLLDATVETAKTQWELPSAATGSPQDLVKVA
jgi:hypothetical protein